MSENLGTARVYLTVDTTDFEARIARSKNLASGLGTEAEAAFNKADAKGKRAAQSILKYAEYVGTSIDQQKRLNAIIAGAPIEIVDIATGKINQQRIAIENAARAAQRLEETKAFEKQAAEAAKLVQATNYVRFWEDALESLDAQEAKMAADKSFIRSLEQQAFAMDKTRVEILELKAAEMGLSAQAAPFIAQMKAKENALRSGGIAFDKYGLSVKQTQAALRQVPAQITDIFVSLQGGQNPLTVLLQQGGQLKDVFGGVAPALRGLAGGLLALLTPVTLTLAGVAALAVGFFKGQQEATEFNKALILTGGRAGVTADQLSDLAASLDELSGVTQSGAAEALTAVVASGKIGADQLEMVTRAAIAMQKTTGAALSDTVAQFVELGKSPVDAVLKLNESQNFLTDTVLAQIIALDNQGRTVEAARLAQETYADSVIARGEEVRENLGFLESAWRAVAGGAKEAWDAMLDIGRADTLSQELKRLEAEARVIQERFDKFGRDGNSFTGKWREDKLAANLARQAEIREEFAAAEKAAAVKNAEAIVDAELRALQTAERQYESEAQRKARARAVIVEGADRAYQQAIELGNTELAALVREREKITLAAFDAKNAEKPKTGGARGEANAGARNALEEIKSALEVERALISNNTKILEAEYKARTVAPEQYYTRLRELMAQDVAAQENAIKAQLEVLRDRNVTGKDSLDVQNQIVKLEADLARVRSDGATSVALLAIAEKTALEDRKRALDNYTDALMRSNAALAMKVNAEIAAIGMGQKQAQQQAQLSEIYADQAEKLRQLNEQLERGDIDPQAYEAKRDALQQATDDRVEIVTDGFRRMDDAQGNWLNGLTAGIQNWMDQASNVAAQVEAITVSSFNRIGDAIADAAITGKFEWRSMLADILKQIIAFMAKQAVLNFLKVLSGGSGDKLSKDDGGGFGAIFGAILGAFTKNAKGGVYDSPSLSAYSNQVHSKPQFFKFAKGAGVFGEAGPEAIMPLTRGPDGNLGVRAQMGAGGGGVQVTVSTVINNDGTASTSTTSKGEDAAQYQRFTDGIRSTVQEEINKAMRPGGSLYKVGVQVS